MSADFIIVGGGIGGAVLAGLLGRAGKKVVVLEKQARAVSSVRPEILWPHTMETLFALRPRESWEQDAALPLRGIEFHDGRSVVTIFSDDVLREPRVQPWSTHPNQTREHLLNLGTFEVRRGVEVLSLLKDAGRVIGVRARDIASRQETDILGYWTVGDDGAQSIARKACEIELMTRAFPVEFMCFGGDWPADVRPGHARIWWNPEALATGIVGLLIVPLPRGMCAALVPILTNAFDANSAVESCWEQFCDIDPTIAAVLDGRRFPTDLDRIKRPWGHARHYGAAGVLLMGDALHPVSPAGGQGANMSIADALAIAELALGGAPNLLSEYETRRRHANESSIWPTRIAASLWSAPRWLSPISLMPFVARRISGCPTLQRQFMRSNANRFREAAA